MEKETKVENLPELVVVKDFPTQKVSTINGENGKEYHLLTVEEALTEILNDIKLIKKSLL